MQGFNMGRYIPPDEADDPNNNTNTSRSRKRNLKASAGTQTVRFECPFAIWCTTCPADRQLIGQGVRFNAEKRKMGNYYSTPIWAFRFKHTVCGGWIEVRTDPKNTEYVVVEGGRRRAEGKGKSDGDGDGEIEVGLARPAGEREGMEKEKEGGFVALEKKVVDRQQLMGQGRRLEALEASRRRDWHDPYEKSRLLRRDFRLGRKLRKEAEDGAERLKEKFGLGLEMLDEDEGDGHRARLVHFGRPEDRARTERQRRQRRRPFERAPGDGTPKDDRLGGGKDGQAGAARKKESLARELQGNTRAVVDPFVADHRAPTWRPSLKSKKAESEDRKDQPVVKQLVEYDSDSPYHSLFKSSM